MRKTMRRLALVGVCGALLLSLCACGKGSQKEQSGKAAFSVTDALEKLCSDDFAGRYSGSAGGQAAGDYVADSLSGWGYQPLLGDSLQTPYTGWMGDPQKAAAQAAILFADGRRQELALGLDYIVTLPESDVALTLPVSTDEAACQDGSAFFLQEEEGASDAPYYIRVSQPLRAALHQPKSLRLEVTDGVFALLKSEGCRLSLSLTACAGESTANNICGVLPGADRTQAIVLGAHFDGSGKWGDTLFPGATDNASGTAALLAAAQSLSGEKLPFDLVIAAFCGEEQGSVGSMTLAQQLEAHYDSLNLINLDCVGTPGENQLYLSTSQPGLAEALFPYLEALGYQQYSTKVMSSDQRHFTQPALTVMEYNDDMMEHTGVDTPDRLNVAQIQAVADGVAEYVRGCTVLPQAVTDEMTQSMDAMAALLAQQRQLVEDGLPYDQAVCVQLDAQSKALLTGWRMLKTPEEVAAYYPGLSVPAQLGDAALFGVYVLTGDGSAVIHLSSSERDGYLADEYYPIHWDKQAQSVLQLFYQRADGSGVAIQWYNEAPAGADGYVSQQIEGYGCGGVNYSGNGGLMKLSLFQTLMEEENTSNSWSIEQNAFSDEASVQALAEQADLPALLQWCQSHSTPQS